MSVIDTPSARPFKLTLCAALMGVTLLGSGGSLFATQAQAADAYTQLPELINHLKQDVSRDRLNFAGSGGVAPYGVTVHASQLLPLLKNSYTATDIATLKSVTANSRTIAVLDKPW